MNKKREVIIFGRELNENEWNGGTKSFESLNLYQINQLLEIGALDLEDTQNNAPSVGKIIEFIKKNPRFVAHGYVVSESRPDCRISFEGVKLEGLSTEEEKKAFIEVFRHADDLEFDNNFLYAWYD